MNEREKDKATFKNDPVGKSTRANIGKDSTMDIIDDILEDFPKIPQEKMDTLMENEGIPSMEALRKILGVIGGKRVTVEGIVIALCGTLYSGYIMGKVTPEYMTYLLRKMRGALDTLERTTLVEYPNGSDESKVDGVIKDFEEKMKKLKKDKLK
jgi:hypothetical protein